MKQTKSLIETIYGFDQVLLKRNQKILEESFSMISNFGELLKETKFETEDPKHPMTL